MGHNRGYRRDEQYAETLEALRNARAIDDASRIVHEFNIRLASRLPLLFTPTIGAALISKHPWLQIHCAGCDVISDVDLRVARRDPEMPITEFCIHSVPTLSRPRSEAVPCEAHAIAKIGLSMKSLSKALIVFGGAAVVFGFFLIDNYQPELGFINNVMIGSVQIIPAPRDLADCIPQYASDGTITAQPFCGLSVSYRLLVAHGLLFACIGIYLHRHAL